MKMRPLDKVVDDESSVGWWAVKRMRFIDFDDGNHDVEILMQTEAYWRLPWVTSFLRQKNLCKFHPSNADFEHAWRWPTRPMPTWLASCSSTSFKSNVLYLWVDQLNLFEAFISEIFSAFSETRKNLHFILMVVSWRLIKIIRLKILIFFLITGGSVWNIR